MSVDVCFNFTGNDPQTFTVPAGLLALMLRF